MRAGGPRQRPVDVLQRQLQVVARAEPADVQVGHRAEDLGIVGIDGQRARVRGARFLDMTELGERGAAEMMGGDAGRIDAVRLAGALERVFVASLFEVASGLLEQVWQAGLAPARHVDAGLGGRPRARAPRFRRAVDRLGDRG